MPGYADQSDADSQRNRMAQEEELNMVEEHADSAVFDVAEQQVRSGSHGTLF